MHETKLTEYESVFQRGVGCGKGQVLGLGLDNPQEQSLPFVFPAGRIVAYLFLTCWEKKRHELSPSASRPDPPHAASLGSSHMWSPMHRAGLTVSQEKPITAFYDAS